MKVSKFGSAAGAAATAAFLLSGGVLAAQGGDSNRGDVWVDSATVARLGVTAAGPGHENDPHLPCGDVGVFAAKMADGSGTISIFSWPPTGSQQDIYDTTWTYTAGAADPQEIAIIPAAVFGTGGHFKLTATQDPAKHKVFWIDCRPEPAGAVGQSTTPSATPTPKPGEKTEGGEAPVTAPGGSVESATASTPAAPASGTSNGPTATSPATTATTPFGAVEAAVATTTAAAGVALAVTGTPALGLVLGIVLLIIGGVILYRRRSAA